MSFPYLSDILNAAFNTHWVLPLPTFGLCVAAAVVLATQILRREIYRLQRSGALPAHASKDVSDLVVVSVVVGMIGARVFHILDYPAQFVSDPMAMIWTRGGFSIYGGLFFGTATAWILLRRRRIPIAPMLDAAAPAMMLGYAIGRIGCQLAGDGDWGIAANLQLKPSWLPDWLWAQTYEGNIAGVMIAAPGVYPTPIYETMMSLVAFAALLALRSQRNRHGYLFSIYLVLAGFERLLIEKIRINIRYDVLGITFSQAEVISVAIIIVGLVGLLTTINTRTVWTKAVLSVVVRGAL
jgi:phosphatidylglycerol:prolipoprotein diacylglycerol transferase